MTTPADFTPYSTIVPYLGTLPSWVSVEEQQRIAAYGAYEEIYWASEQGFAEVLRGDNDNPVFMPTARTLVDTVNRYTATGFNYTVTAPEGTSGDAVAIAKLAFQQLFAREQFFSKFNANKRKGLFRGDWLWHIIADDTKPIGKRIKIMTVDPAAYFPVTDPDDPDRILKVHLAEQIDVDGQTRISRLTYTRVFDANNVQTGITVEHGIFDPDGWMDSTKPERTVLPLKELPPEIPAIPVYHLKNWDSTAPYGSSELRGLESVLLGINQTISDEDMTLGIEGIGVYATDGGAPVDATGKAVEFIMGPGRVITHAAGLKRIDGATNVTAYGDHYDRLMGAVRQAVGASDAAIGKVGAEAESGVALLLELGPLLSYTAEKDVHILDVHAQMFHDLCFWLTVYEELPLIASNPDGDGNAPVVVITPTVGEKIPVNRKQVVAEVVQLRGTIPPLISQQTALEMLAAAGVAIASDEAQRLITEAAGELEAGADDGSGEEADQARLDEEANAGA